MPEFTYNSASLMISSGMLSSHCVARDRTAKLRIILLLYLIVGQLSGNECVNDGEFSRSDSLGRSLRCTPNNKPVAVISKQCFFLGYRYSTMHDGKHFASSRHNAMTVTRIETKKISFYYIYIY